MAKSRLAPAGSLDTALAQRDGTWGAALDATLAERMGIAVGDAVEVGDLSLSVRALITRQPDRSLRADWGGAPVLVAEGALMATGLVQPLSRVDYRYRVRTDQPASAWRDAFMAAFPALDAEVDTFDERSERMAEVLGQIGSGLLLIGFSALFIGGLGVFNSVQAYLQGKLTSLATLRALGLRDGRLAAMVLLQIVMLALLASGVGVLVGNALALAGALATAERLPIGLLLGGLWQSSLVALAFGVLTAVAFALPALGRALSVTPAALFRGVDAQALHTPRRAWWLTAAVAALVVSLLVITLPDPRFGLAFVLATALLLGLLDLVTRGLRALARRLQAARGWSPPLALQLALANLQQPASPHATGPALARLGAHLAGGLHAGGHHAAAHGQRHRAGQRAGAGVLRRADRADSIAERHPGRFAGLAAGAHRAAGAGAAGGGEWRGAARKRRRRARARSARRAQAEQPRRQF